MDGDKTEIKKEREERAMKEREAEREEEKKRQKLSKNTLRLPLQIDLEILLRIYSSISPHSLLLFFFFFFLSTYLKLSINSLKRPTTSRGKKMLYAGN